MQKMTDVYENDRKERFINACKHRRVHILEIFMRDPLTTPLKTMTIKEQSTALMYACINIDQLHFYTSTYKSDDSYIDTMNKTTANTFNVLLILIKNLDLHKMEQNALQQLSEIIGSCPMVHKKEYSRKMHKTFEDLEHVVETCDTLLPSVITNIIIDYII
jgi:hypothetical protein